MKYTKIAIMLLALQTIFFTTLFAQDQPTGLKVGDTAPNFKGRNQNGKLLSLKKLLTTGSVVIVFYRGEWCPHCNRQLKSLQDSLSLITAKGASVVAITPEKSENVEKTIQKTQVSFQVVSDIDLKIMNAYKVTFAWDTATTSKYKSYGINLTEKNASKQNVLPVPAVYIIGKDGKIKYSFFNQNYEKRATVKEILGNL